MAKDPFKVIPYTNAWDINNQNWTSGDVNAESWTEVQTTDAPRNRRKKGTNSWDNARAKAALKVRDAKVKALRERKRKQAAEINRRRQAAQKDANARGKVRDSRGRVVRDSSGKAVRTRYPSKAPSAAHLRNLRRLRQLGLFSEGGSPSVPQTNAKIGDHVRLPTKAELAAERRDRPGAAIDASTARAMSDRDLSRFMALEERVVRQRYEKSIRDREARKRRR